MPGNPVVGSTILRRPAIASPNYSAGSAGWTINVDGSAEFNNITIRGSLSEPQIQVNANGIKIFNPGGQVLMYLSVANDGLFLYADAGPATQGALIASMAAAAGTSDPMTGAPYEQGVAVYTTIAGTRYGLRQGSSTVNGSPSPSLFLDNLTGSAPSTSPAYSYGAASSAGTAAVMYSGTATGAAVAAYLELADSVLSGQAAGEAVLNASLVTLPATGAWIQADSWNDMRPLSNSFVGTIASRYPPQYRMTTDGDVEVAGFVQFPPSGGPNFNSVTFATVGSAYRPGHDTGHRWPVTFETNVAPVGTPCVQVDTSGNLQFHNCPASGMTSNIANISGRYPLDKTGIATS